MFAERFEPLTASFLRRQHEPATMQRAARVVRAAAPYLSRDLAIAVAERRLRRSLRHAAAAGGTVARQLEGHRVRTFDDLAGVVPMTSDDVRDRGAMLCVDEADVAASYTSSGTTGRPKRIDFDFGDAQLQANLGAMTLRMEYPAVPIAMAIAMPLTHGLWVGWRQVMHLVERAGGIALPLGVGEPGELVASMKMFGATMLATSPTYAAMLTEAAKAKNYRPKLDAILLGAEACSADQQAGLADYWGCRVWDIYATTEIGVGFAFSAPGGTAVRFDELHVWPEIVDGDGNAADEGELLVTTLTRRAMPLLRYKIGDRARWCDRDGEPESLLNKLPFRSIEILGRADDILVIAGSNVDAKELAKAACGEGKVAIRATKDGHVTTLHLSTDADVDPAEIERRVRAWDAHLAEHLDAGKARLETTCGADLSKQLKPLSTKDER